jgi:DNA polymerase III gamma/tau subunit
LVDADAVAALKSLAELSREGWDPEQLAENFAAEVRQVFLLQVAPQVADAVDSDRDRLTEWGNQLGLPRTVRVLETVGRAMREMKSAPEKIVILEVAMVRLIRPELDSTIDALDERLTKLERDGVRIEPTLPAPPAVLRPIGAATPATTHRPEKVPAPAPTAEAVEPEMPTRIAEGGLDLDDVRARFVERVIPRTSRGAQLLLKSAFVRSLDGQTLTIALPSEEMRQNTELIAQGLRSAMEHEFKSPLQITWAVDVTLASGASAPTTSARPIGARETEVEESYAGDETVIVVDSAGDHLITEMFPGATEIT